MHGYAGVSVRTLSRELGVSHGWAHQRFGSKEALWYAAVDHGFGRQTATLSFDPTVSDPLEQLEEGIRQFLLYSSEHPELAMLMNTEGAQDTPRLDYVNEHYIEPTAEPFVRLLTHLIDEGRAGPSPGGPSSSSWPTARRPCSASSRSDGGSKPATPPARGASTSTSRP